MRLRKILILVAAILLYAAVARSAGDLRGAGQAQFLNDRSREIIGSDILNAPGFVTPAGLTGKGQVVAVADSGVDRGSLEDIHPDLASDPNKKPRIIMLKSWSGRPVADDPVGHGTHMVGTIVGNGKSSGGKFKGVAPDASIYFQGILDDKGRVAPPANVEDLFMPAYLAGARIHVNGWGTGSGGYSGTALKTDRFIRKYPDFLVIFGAGNSGPGSRTLTSEAGSKNALVVGSSVSPRPALDFSPEGTLDTAQFSSRGPTADGRIKPDLLAPGTSIISTRSSLVKGNLPGFPMYTRMQGSSMASAVAAGSAALMREFMQREMSVAQPLAATVKAALINGARTPDTGPSGGGFGVMDLAGTVLALKEKTMALEEEIWGLPDGGTKTYKIKVTHSGAPFKATLAWTDPSGNTSSANALVNNLDLLVTAPDGKTYSGNSFLGDGPDGINNVEQVYIKDPLPGEYMVKVIAASVPVSAVKNTPVSMQDYSLVYGQPLSTGIIKEVASGGNLEIYGGQEINISGKDVHYILNGNSSKNLSPEPGYRLYYGGASAYVVGRRWNPESVLFRDGIGGRVWFEADGDNREGGYYQNQEALKGVTVNGTYREDVSELPPGVGLEASLDGVTQTLWNIVTGYRTKKGNIDQVVRGDDGDITSVYLFRDRKEYRLSPEASYIYNDIFEGSDPLETAFGSGRLDGLGRIMPGQQVTLVVSPASGSVSS
ncbi:MAG: S8 family serine peptidase, partial [Bacillota bacterium]